MQRALLEATKIFCVLSVVACGFFAYGAVQNQSVAHANLLWNLVLAWVPFGLSVLLYALLRSYRWSAWPPLIVTILWLCFLPNSFYLLTDLIHLQKFSRVDEVFDVLIFSSFISTGLLLGYTSLALVHLQLRKRLADSMTWRIVALILLLSSFAIYVGRDLRWNSWDIITNPAGILFDLSERIIHPFAHPQTYVTTLSFFIFLGIGYVALWRGMHLIRNFGK